MRRMTAAALGKIPTTRLRRLISLLTRSSGLVDQILRQWALGEGGEREDLGLRVVHQRPDLGERAGELVADLVPGLADGLGVGLGEDRAEHRGDHVGVTLGDVRQKVAGEVDPAPLVRGALEGPLQRCEEPGVLIADDQLHTAQATLFEAEHEGAPEGLVLTVADIESQDFPEPVAAITGGHDDGHGDDLVALAGLVAHVQVGRVEVDVGERRCGQGTGCGTLRRPRRGPRRSGRPRTC